MKAMFLVAAVGFLACEGETYVFSPGDGVLPEGDGEESTFSGSESEAMEMSELKTEHEAECADGTAYEASTGRCETTCDGRFFIEGCTGENGAPDYAYCSSPCGPGFVRRESCTDVKAYRYSQNATACYESPIPEIRDCADFPRVVCSRHCLADKDCWGGKDFSYESYCYHPGGFCYLTGCVHAMDCKQVLDAGCDGRTRPEQTCSFLFWALNAEGK